MPIRRPGLQMTHSTLGKQVHLRGQPPFALSSGTLCGLCSILFPLATTCIWLDCGTSNISSLSALQYCGTGTWVWHLRQSLAWLARVSSPWDAWITFVSLDTRWKGHLTRALKSCLEYRQTHAVNQVWQVWLTHELGRRGVMPAEATIAPPCPWICDLCDRAFASKRALAMHAVQSQALCDRRPLLLFHNRARLSAHLRYSEDCLQRVRAVFPPLSVEEMEALNDADRAYAVDMEQCGWLPTKTHLPAGKAIGPRLPPWDSEAAQPMMTKWQADVLPLETSQVPTPLPVLWVMMIIYFRHCDCHAFR